jgi:tetratricopeptide (TPR) repeat protein
VEATVKKTAKSLPLWVVLVLFLLGQPLLSITGFLLGTNFFWVDMDMARLNQQLEHFRSLVNAEPDNPSHRTELGFTYFTVGDYRAALDQLSDAISLDENYLPAYLSRGYVHVELGRLDEALSDFQKVKELAPEDFRGHLNTGIVFRELGMFVEAVAELERARSLAANSSDIYYHLALTYEAMGEMASALSVLDRALELDPLNQDAQTARFRLQGN